MKKVFFQPTRNAIQSLTKQFEFLWPTATAIWNLRWQVKGLVDACPEISDEQLVGRFVVGSGIRSGSLRRICVDTPWEEQQSRFAEFLLISVFAVYESWSREILQSLGYPSSKRKEKGLQFPTRYDANGASVEGLHWVIAEVNSTESAAMAAISSELANGNKKCCIEKLDVYMRWFRYFKETRNCTMHNGGKVSENLRAATVEVSSIDKAIDIGMKKAIRYFPELDLENDVRLSLHGVVGLSLIHI